jgi:hypothetical protein
MTGMSFVVPQDITSGDRINLYADILWLNSSGQAGGNVQVGFGIDGVDPTVGSQRATIYLSENFAARVGSAWVDTAITATAGQTIDFFARRLDGTGAQFDPSVDGATFTSTGVVSTPSEGGAAQGEANTQTNQGGGVELGLPKSGLDLPIRTLDTGQFELNGNQVRLQASLLAPYVQGPASATDGHLTIFDLTTGKLVKDGGLDIVNVVRNTGTPLATQIGVFTADNILSGIAGFTLTGNDLAVPGNIAVTGTVDGRDVAVDGTELDNHVGVGGATAATHPLATQSLAGMMPTLSGVATEFLNGVGAFAAPARPTYVRRQTTGYALSGPLTVLTAQQFFVALQAGQALALLGLIYQLGSGDSATVSVLVNGTPITGLIGLGVTTSKQSTYITPQSLADEDSVTVDITAVGSTPNGISLGVVIQETLS